MFSGSLFSAEEGLAADGNCELPKAPGSSSSALSGDVLTPVAAVKTLLGGQESRENSLRRLGRLQVAEGVGSGLWAVGGELQAGHATSRVVLEAWLMPGHVREGVQPIF